MIAGDQAKSGGASPPLPKGAKGDRDTRGRFRSGHQLGGPGNPFAQRVAQLRSMILEAVTEDDLRAVILALIKRAKDGDISAIRELLDRLVGKAPSPVLLDLQELEERKLRLAEDRQVAVRWKT